MYKRSCVVRIKQLPFAFRPEIVQLFKVNPNIDETFKCDETTWKGCSIQKTIHVSQPFFEVAVEKNLLKDATFGRFLSTKSVCDANLSFCKILILRTRVTQTFQF